VVLIKHRYWGRKLDYGGQNVLCLAVLELVLHFCSAANVIRRGQYVERVALTAERETA